MVRFQREAYQFQHKVMLLDFMIQADHLVEKQHLLAIKLVNGKEVSHSLEKLIKCLKRRCPENIQNNIITDI